MWAKLLTGRTAFAIAGTGNQATLSIPRRRIHLFEILAVPAALLSLGDAFLTQYMVGLGRVQEGNPLMAKLLANNQFLGFKIAGILLCLGLLWMVSKRFPRLAGGAALFITVFYCAVLIWNSSVMTAV